MNNKVVELASGQYWGVKRNAKHGLHCTLYV